ncbi:MAG: hypothetical protein LBN27_03630 [Prevotellaceae bacterium]|jgi:hypothetical protein|nr:hypothetical protein [Prevotellaceae bacterium]
MQEKSLIKKNILKYLDFKGVSKYKFYQETGITRGVLDQNNGMSEENTAKFLAYYNDVATDWLLLGRGEMLKNSNKNAILSPESSKKIPLYDTSTIGGTNELMANMEGVAYPSEYIDTGDWFREATAAIRHYGDSMIEYPPGSILALKEVIERQLIIWGKDYVIETNEYRLTKCVQKGMDSEHIAAYSSNTERHPDGRLKHEPVDIHWSDIRRIYLVLGYVVKNNGGTILYSN